MTTGEMMNIDERYKYLRIMRPRYRGASREEKGRLLDEMEQVTGLHRKHLIQLLHGDLERHPRKRERGMHYDPELDAALSIIAESFDYVCAERITPNLLWMAECLEVHGELQLTTEVRTQLEQISVSSVRRHLARLAQDQPRFCPKGRPYGAALLRSIPMKRLPWNETTPGYLEADLVHHCGPSATGEYVCTLQLIDVATGWSERVAVLGRSYRVMEDAFRHILQRLPFSVIEIHPDNGSEFFNAHLLRFFGEVAQGVHLSRSRPYHKNDNRFVEQKNSTLVRHFLGYERLDTVAQTLALNLAYEKMWVYYNLFQPVLRLGAKEVLPAEREGNRIKRHYGPPQTPFDRLCATGAISPERRRELERLRDRTNPRRLRQEIYDLVEHILSLPGAIPGQPEDVNLTLGVYTIFWG